MSQTEFLVPPLLLNTISDAVSIVDAAGRVVEWNDAAATAYGWSATEMIGESIERIIPEALRDAERHLRGRLHAGEAPRIYDATRTARSGRQIIVTVTATRLPRDTDESALTLLVERDRTMERTMESQLLRAKQWEVVGQLGAGVAHEFNNNLTAIFGLASLMMGKIVPGHPIAADIATLRDHAQQSARLVRHLLSFTAAERGTGDSISVDDTIRQLAPILRRVCGERVLFSTDLSAPAERLAVDPRIVAVTLFETLSNALGACSGQATLVVSTSVVLIGGDTFGGQPARAGRYASIRIRDTGRGLTPEASIRAVDPYFTTRHEDAHLGLGLTMVRHLVEGAGGLLLVTPSETIGAVVEVLLPSTTAVSRATATPDAPAVDLSGEETILLVEDDPMVRNIAARSLRERGYDVIEAKNGADALLAAEHHARPIHLVVTDVVMPDMDGRELFDCVRRWYPKLAVLFISGYTRGAISAQQIEQENTSFLAKPFELDVLGAEVRALLDGRQSRPRGAVAAS
ncbi:MAG: Blue-light-activated protein [Gemmatimonadetes bacterium]|nr:Blue-light-activated protein [Gemmatimonadota bacterium]